jgi:hypothetical protein
MRLGTAAAIGLCAVTLAAAPVSSASARGHHHFCGPFCIVGAVVTGAAVVATAPFAIAGAALGPPGYYAPPPPAYYAPPPPRAYYPPPPAYYAPPPGYYAPPPGYYAPPRPANYGPPGYSYP